LETVVMSRGSKFLGAVAVVVLAVAGSAPVLAQSGDLRELLNRLNRIETDIQTLQRQAATGGAGRAGSGAPAGAAPAAGGAAYEVRMSEIEDLVRTLTGRVERTEFGVRQANERIERMATDLEFRLSQLEQRASAPAPAAAPAAQAPAAPTPAGQTPVARPAQTLPASPPAATPAPVAATRAPPPASLTQGSAEEQYAAAYRLIEQRQLAQAEQAFQQFLRGNGRHRLADNARYWLAETHYARRQFDQAAVAFAEAYQAAPKGEKAADNLLKLGLSLSQMRRKDDACNTFTALSKEFPNLPSSQRQRVQQERAQLGCPA
jgi:tol-pal system protein YbgF